MMINALVIDSLSKILYHPNASKEDKMWAKLKIEMLLQKIN